MHPEDPSLAPARKLHKKRWLVDMTKIQAKIPLSAVEPGALVIFDDCLEMGRSDPRRLVVYDLLNDIVIRGRHRKGKKGNRKRGVECAALTHYGSNRSLQTVRNACKYWVLFPSCSRNQSIHMLRTRLHYTKKQTEALLDRSGDSRFAMFRHHAPQLVISSNHLEILN
mgnify:CR=1 FL=1